MKTKSIPAIIMLGAGFIACIAGMNAHMEVAEFLKMLFIVLVVFYVLGCIVKLIVDKNFMEMKEETTDGEETEAESDSKTDEEAESEDEE